MRGVGGVHVPSCRIPIGIAGKQDVHPDHGTYELPHGLDFGR